MIIKDLDHLEVVELENPTGGYSWINGYVNNLLSQYLPSFSSSGSYGTPSSVSSAPSSSSRNYGVGNNDVDVSINGNTSPGVRSFTTPDGNGFVQVGGASNGGGRSYSYARSGDFAAQFFS